MDINNNQRIAKNTLYLYIRMALSLVITLYTSRIILNVLGVIDYGVYNVVAGFVSMFAFLNGALNASIQRFYNYENGINGEKGFQQVYITAFFIQLILAVLALLLVESIGLWYFDNYIVIPQDRIREARVLFHVSVISMMLVIMQVPYSSAILAKEKMDYYAFAGIIDVVLKLIIVFLLDMIKLDKLETYAWLMAVVSFVDFLLYYVYSRIKFKELQFCLCFYPELFKSMLNFSVWSAFGSFSQVIRHQGINILLNFFFGPIVNAARGISYQVKSALIGFVGNVTMASRPQMTEVYAAGNVERSIRLMNSSSKLCFLLMFMMALPISVEIEYVLDVWLKHIVPEHTKVFTVLVLLSTLIDVLQSPIGIMIYATGKIKKFNLYTSVVSIMILPIAFIILKLGAKPELVYVASILLSFIIQVISVNIMSKLTGYSRITYFKEDIFPLIIVAVLSCIIPLGCHIYMNTGLLRLIIVILTSVSIVGIMGYYIAFDSSEKMLVKDLGGRVLSKIYNKCNKSKL